MFYAKFLSPSPLSHPPSISKHQQKTLSFPRRPIQDPLRNCWQSNTCPICRCRGNRFVLNRLLFESFSWFGLDLWKLPISYINGSLPDISKQVQNTYVNKKFSALRSSALASVVSIWFPTLVSTYCSFFSGHLLYVFSYHWVTPFALFWNGFKDASDPKNGDGWNTRLRLPIGGFWPIFRGHILYISFREDDVVRFLFHFSRVFSARIVFRGSCRRAIDECDVPVPVPGPRPPPPWEAMPKVKKCFVWRY